MAKAEIQHIAAMCNCSTRLFRLIDISANLAQMLRRDDRAHLRADIERIADDHFLRQISNAPNNLIDNRAMHDQSRTSIAAFACIEPCAEHGRIDKGIHIRIREQDLRILTTKFQRYFFQRLRGIGHGQLTDTCGTGERHHVHIRMRAHMLANISARSGDDVDDTVRDACLSQNFAE